MEMEIMNQIFLCIVIMGNGGLRHTECLQLACCDVSILAHCAINEIFDKGIEFLWVRKIVVAREVGEVALPFSCTAAPESATVPICWAITDASATFVLIAHSLHLHWVQVPIRTTQLCAALVFHLARRIFP